MNSHRHMASQAGFFLLLLAAVAKGQQAGLCQAVHLGKLDDSRINESSGLAYSRRGQPILWTHNDSGDGPFLYALDPSNGQLRGFFVVEGAQAYDWEDMASCRLDDEAFLVIADTGDNDAKREACDLYWVREPDVPISGSVITDKVEVVYHLRFTYEDGPHDCEALAVAEDGRTAYLISKVGKKDRPAQMYEVTLPSCPWIGTLVARAVSPIDIPRVVAMDFSSDEQRAIVLTYENAYEFARAPNHSWREAFFAQPREIPMPWRSQGESICYGPDSITLYLTSENLPAPLWRVDRTLSPPETQTAGDQGTAAPSPASDKK